MTKNRGKATRANSTTAVPRSQPYISRKGRRAPRRDPRIAWITTWEPLQPCASPTSGLDVFDDLVEDRRHPATEGGEDRDRDDRDEEEDQRVLHKRLPLLAIPDGPKREIDPRRKRVKHIHYLPPSWGFAQRGPPSQSV